MVSIWSIYMFDFYCFVSTIKTKKNFSKNLLSNSISHFKTQVSVNFGHNAINNMKKI